MVRPRVTFNYYSTLFTDIKKKNKTVSASASWAVPVVGETKNLPTAAI